MWVLFRGTLYGLKLKAVGRNRRSSFLIGIATNRYLLGSFMICGALAGLAGTSQATGFQYKLIPAISGNYGFLAILVVLLARFRPFLVIPISFFFAMIAVGSSSLSLRLDVNPTLGGVLQGVLVLSAMFGLGWAAYRAQRSERASARRAAHEWRMDAFVDMFDTATIATIFAGASGLMFATMGETISEKAGVINLSVDGSMMLSALAGFVVAFQTGNVWLGFPAAALVGLAVALIVALGSIKLSLNQVAVGFVLFALCTELSRFLGNSFVGRPPVGVPAWGIPGLKSIPFFGPVLFDHNVVVYLSYLTVIATYVFMYRTRKGLELQGIGERPEAAHSRGIPVNKLRYLYTALGGALIGIGGAAFSLDVKLGWSDRPTRNLGWIVLAIVIFGGWHPLRAAIRCVALRRVAGVRPQPAATVPQPVPGATEHSLPRDDPGSGRCELEGPPALAGPLPVAASHPAQ